MAGRGRFPRERIYVYTWPIHCAVQQRLTQRYKAVIVQFKKKDKKGMGSSQVSNVLFETCWVDQRFFFFFTSNPVVICAVFPGVNGDSPMGVYPMAQLF